MKKLEEYVRTIPDFPEPGIMFRDVTSVIQDMTVCMQQLMRCRQWWKDWILMW